MLKDRNYSIALISTLLSDFGQISFDDDPKFRNLLRRAEMVAGKIFGTESNYVEDLREGQRMMPSPERNDHIQGILKIMLEDLQLDNMGEVNAKIQAGTQKANTPIIEGWERMTMPTDERVEEVRKMLTQLQAELARAQKQNAEMQERALKDAKEFADQDYARRRTAEEEFERRITGFIFIPLDDSAKGDFHDLLKGFEDYAKLKGYDVSVSVDVSRPNQLGFKFTFGGSVRTVTKQDVQRDLHDYIAKIQSGEDLKDFPQTLPLAEHHTAIFIMQGRMNFLNHTIKQKDNLLRWQQQIIDSQLLDKFPQQPLLPNQTITLHMHQDNKPALTQSIVVGSTPEEQSKMIELLQQVIAKYPKAEFIADHLSDAQTELKSGRPDPARMAKILEPIKYGLKALGLLKEIKEAAGPTWDALKIWLGLDL